MLIDEYFEKKPGPLGSKDIKCPLDVEALFSKLNEEGSEMASLWTECGISDWVKKLGVESLPFTPQS